MGPAEINNDTFVIFLHLLLISQCTGGGERWMVRPAQSWRFLKVSE